jgi:hypothetical protein
MLDPLRKTDFVTVKYNPSGQLLWQSHYSGPDSSQDEAYYLVPGSDGRIYVTGESYRSPDFSISEIVTIKYDYNGAEEWVARYNDPNSTCSTPCGIRVDFDGNVFVSGTTDLSYITVKYDENGELRWSARYPGDQGESCRTGSFEIDSDGNVYVAGSRNFDANRDDLVVIKYDSTGQQEWLAAYPSPQGYVSSATGIDLDPDGNIYVAGYIAEYDAPILLELIKYSNSGARQWAEIYDGLEGPQQGVNISSAMIVDRAGNSYLTGWSLRSRPDSGAQYDYATLKYDTDGQQLWSVFYHGVGLFGDGMARSIALDSLGNVYVTGMVSDSLDDYGDYVTIKYDSSGNQEWIERAGRSGRDNAVKVAVDSENNVVVTGTSGHDFLTIKYSQSPASIKGPQATTPSKPALHSAYPNPFNSATTIGYSNLEPGEIGIFDIRGSLVKRLKVALAGNASVTWDGSDENGGVVSSGFYFASIKSHFGLETIRLVYLK